jgi:hypothetical protein
MFFEGHASFHNLRLSGANVATVSEVYASAMLLLPVTG